MRTKKPHFVPRFYLDRFADANGNLWQYDLELKKVIGSEAEKIGLAGNFYSPLKADGTRNDSLEGLLTDIESFAAPLFERLEQGENFIGEDRDAIAVFLATQYLRSPVMVSIGAELYAKAIHRLTAITMSNDMAFKENMDKLDVERGKSTTDAERENIRIWMSKEDRYSLSVIKHAGLSVLGSAPQLAELFANLTWLVVEPKGQHLITSDSPVVRSYDPKTFSPTYGDGGFFNKTMYVTFPLSPTRMLEMSWKKPITLPKIVVSDKEQGKFYNRQRVSWFDRFLYSSERDDGVMRLGLKARTKGKGYRTDVGGPSPDVNVVRKLS
jgi:Protein of unknown function (DUF4238)